MPENMQALFDLLIEIWNTGNTARIAEVFSAQVKRMKPGLTEPITGIESVVAELAEIYSAFPDFHLHVVSHSFAGDQMVIEWVTTGTHKGVYMGIPATGRVVTLSGATLSRLENNRIVDDRRYYDTFSMLQQLGVIPEPGAKSTSA